MGSLYMQHVIDVARKVKDTLSLNRFMKKGRISVDSQFDARKTIGKLHTGYAFSDEAGNAPELMSQLSKKNMTGEQEASFNPSYDGTSSRI